MPAMAWEMTRLRISPGIIVERGIRTLRAVPQPFSHNRIDPDDLTKGFPNAGAEMYDIHLSLLDIPLLVAELFTLLLTDFLVYKPVMILECLAYLTTGVLLVTGFGLLSMQFMQLIIWKEALQIYFLLWYSRDRAAS